MSVREKWKGKGIGTPGIAATNKDFSRIPLTFICNYLFIAFAILKTVVDDITTFRLQKIVY